MTFQITLSPAGTRFSCSPQQTILEAAFAANLVLPYGCKNGSCGSCKCFVASGQWVQEEQNVLSAEELATLNQAGGAILPCSAKPLSDMTLNAKALAGLDGLSIRKLPARIAAIERPEANVAILTLQLPATPPFTFKAGQYIDLLLRDGRRRSYSMANPPHSGNIVLHIRKQNKGAISALLFPETEDECASAWKERDLLRLEGPFGTFFLREDSTKPIILLASGTGFAPIQAIVERAHYHGMQRPMTLYWGGNRPSDLYALPTCERWQAEIPGFRFVPVISAATAADHWQGRSGFVHQAVITDFPDLSGYEVYACGAPAMIAAARADFNRLRQLPADAFFADSFESSVPTASLNA